MVDAIDKDDLATAHRQVSKPKKKVAAMLWRGLVSIRKAETLTIPDKEPEKGQVYDALLDMNKLIAKAIQGKVHTLFPMRVSTPLAFAESIRDVLTAIDELATCISKTMALLLACDVQQLQQKSFAELQTPLRAVGDLWRLCLGDEHLGKQLGRNMVSPLLIWSQVDPHFAMWVAFAEHDDSTPMALIERIIKPRALVWMTNYWESLRSGSEVPTSSMADFLDHTLMKREYDDYNDMHRMANSIERGNSGGPGTVVKKRDRGGRHDRDRGDRGKGDRADSSDLRHQLNNKKGGCNYCRTVKGYPENQWRNHSDEDCGHKKRKRMDEMIAAGTACKICRTEGHSASSCPDKGKSTGQQNKKKWKRKGQGQVDAPLETGIVPRPEHRKIKTKLVKFSDDTTVVIVESRDIGTLQTDNSSVTDTTTSSSAAGGVESARSPRTVQQQGERRPFPWLARFFRAGPVAAGGATFLGPDRRPKAHPATSSSNRSGNRGDRKSGESSSRSNKNSRSSSSDSSNSNSSSSTFSNTED